MQSDIRKSLMRKISGKLSRVGIGENELGNSFDLVKSGLVNSLELVELVASLEKEFNCEIDFESAFENGQLTTLGGLIQTFEKQVNG